MANKQRKSFFMPRLCRLSINDVVPKPIPKSSSTDPSSPKLSCTGRVKKRSTNKNNITISANNNNNNNNNNSSRFLVGTSNSNNNSSRFSTSSRFLTSTKSLFQSNRYTKLPSLFSKTLISPAIDTATMINNSNPKRVNYMKKSKSCNGRRRSIPMNTKRYYKNSKDDHDIVRDVMVAGKLDPPLPVVKCGGRDPEVNGNLSKRRGIEIKSLQIQPII